MRRKRDPSIIYLVWLVIIVAASLVFPGVAITIANSIPEAKGHGTWLTVSLNVLVPGAVGVFAGIVVVHILSSRNQLVSTARGHLFRAAPWYLLTCFLVWVLAKNWGISDFSLWSQIIVWPLCATIGALLADIFLSWRKSQVRARDGDAIGA